MKQKELYHFSSSLDIKITVFNFTCQKLMSMKMFDKNFNEFLTVHIVKIEYFGTLIWVTLHFYIWKLESSREIFYADPRPSLFAPTDSKRITHKNT